ncbi:hypothetical protein LC55x_0147 [Lysobacter capsici]|nr:hypothetical protein LC55x_0147 [Lysobacter capsici]
MSLRVLSACHNDDYDGTGGIDGVGDVSGVSNATSAMK